MPLNQDLIDLLQLQAALNFAAEKGAFPPVRERRFAGLKIAIENPAGSTRSGVSRDGKRWAVRMRHDYGFIRRATGADGEGLDVFLGPDPSAPDAYIVHQNDPSTGRYDEDKVMLGFRSADHAKRAYLANYDRPDFFRSLTILPMAKFKKMLTAAEHGSVHWKRKQQRDHGTAAMFSADDEHGGGGRWITIGGAEETNEHGRHAKHAGGTPVYIGKGGTIEKGPQSLTGRNVKNLHKHPVYDRHTGSVHESAKPKGNHESEEGIAQAVNRGEKTVDDILDSHPHLAGEAYVAQKRREAEDERKANERQMAERKAAESQQQAAAAAPTQQPPQPLDREKLHQRVQQLKAQGLPTDRAVARARLEAEGPSAKPAAAAQPQAKPQPVQRQLDPELQKAADDERALAAKLRGEQPKEDANGNPKPAPVEQPTAASGGEPAVPADGNDRGNAPAGEEGTQPGQPTAPEQSVKPRKGSKAKGSGISRAAIERTMMEHMGQSDAGYTREDEKALNEAAGGGDPFTFHGQLPTEIKTYMQGRPELRKLFKVSNDVRKAGGADAFGALGDRYLDIASRKAGGGVGQAVEAARNSNDPQMRFLASLHDLLGPGTDRGEEEPVAAHELQPGEEMTVAGGVPVEVVENEDGEKILQDHGALPDTPVDALDGMKLPVDKGSRREKPVEEIGDDPFGDILDEPSEEELKPNEPVGRPEPGPAPVPQGTSNEPRPAPMGQPAERRSPSNDDGPAGDAAAAPKPPRVEPIRASKQLGMFGPQAGQEIGGLTGSQQSMFQPPPEKPKEPEAEFPNYKPEDTGEMFPAKGAAATKPAPGSKEEYLDALQNGGAGSFLDALDRNNAVAKPAAPRSREEYERALQTGGASAFLDLLEKNGAIPAAPTARTPVASGSGAPVNPPGVAGSKELPTPPPAPAEQPAGWNNPAADGDWQHVNPLARPKPRQPDPEATRNAEAGVDRRVARENERAVGAKKPNPVQHLREVARQMEARMNNRDLPEAERAKARDAAVKAHDKLDRADPSRTAHLQHRQPPDRGDIARKVTMGRKVPAAQLNQFPDIKRQVQAPAAQGGSPRPSGDVGAQLRTRIQQLQQKQRMPFNDALAQAKRELGLPLNYAVDLSLLNADFAETARLLDLAAALCA